MDSKFFEIKRKHHYVWADYLKRWSTDGLNVFHTTKSRKIKSDSVRGIAMDLDFYKLTTLSERDIQFILKCSSIAAEDLQELHRSYLDDFIKFQNIKNLYRSSGKIDETAEKAIKALESKLLENLHSAHEREAHPILDELSKGNLSTLYKKEHTINFTTYLAHQLTRTKNFKERVFNYNSPSNKKHSELLANLKNSWWLLSYMLGINLGRELYIFRSKYTHSLLINRSRTPFITSDQPAINIHPHAWTGSSNPDFLDLYYPISPEYAYVIAQSDKYPSGVATITATDAIQLNSKIAARAKIHIIGSSGDSLKPLVQLIGSDRLPL